MDHFDIRSTDPKKLRESETTPAGHGPNTFLSGAKYVIDGVLYRLVEINDRWAWEEEPS